MNRPRSESHRTDLLLPVPDLSNVGSVAGPTDLPPPEMADVTIPPDRATPPCEPPAGGLPRTLAEFNALSPDQRLAAAFRMTPRQRDAILGRGAPADQADRYL